MQIKFYLVLFLELLCFFIFFDSIGFCASDKTATLILKEWSPVGHKTYHLAQLYVLVVSQTFVIVQASFFISFLFFLK